MLSVLLKDTQQMTELKAEPQQPPEPTFLWHVAAILSVPLSTHAPQDVAKLKGWCKVPLPFLLLPVFLLFANPVSVPSGTLTPAACGCSRPHQADWPGSPPRPGCPPGAR